MDNLKQLAAKYYDEVVALRRHFHTHPELSNQEFNTQQRIMEELTSLGLEPRKIAGTGVVAELKGSLPGKTVAVRADIDALELQDECGKPYQSVNPGACHACGHDGHMSMLIGLAKLLVGMKDKLPGTVRFLFQPAEEKLPGGAMTIIAEGGLSGVDAIIGAHLWQPVQIGTIGLSYDRFMASADEFTITVQGRGGHGSMPHQTVDALLVGAQIAVALNTIVSRNVNPLEQAVISLGVFKAGDVFNIIPDTAVLNGTVRVFDQTVRLDIFSRIEQITKGICEAAGATYSFDKVFGYPPLINNADITAVFAAAGAETLGADNVLTVKPSMGAEDFSYYLEKVPGAFIFIGAGNPEKGISHPHHHPKFDIDERSLGYGLEIMARTALKLLSK